MKPLDINLQQNASETRDKSAYFPTWLGSSKSAGAILDDNNGIGPGFDFLRLFLSVCVIVDHCYQNFLGDYASEIIELPIIYTILGIFFALSGFLVTGSAIRTMSLPTFISFRILRIVPALTVETILSALVLGPLLTTLPLHEYFTHSLFFRYFGNIVGEVQVRLPGVLPSPGKPNGIINYNLWTLRPEFSCYAIMSLILITSSLTKYRLLVFAVLFSVAVLFLSVFNIYPAINGHLRWHLLVYAFLLGSLFYLYRYSIPINVGACIVSFIVAVLIIQIPGHRFVPLAVPLLVYVTVCLGMWRLPLFGLFKRGDYSYGMYLYGYPITACLWYFIPTLRNGWLMLPPAALLSTFVFAFVSWHLIEKPALSLRKRLFKRAKVITHI